MQGMQYLYHKSDLHSPITIGVDLIFKIVFLLGQYILQLFTVYWMTSELSEFVE